MSTLDTGLTLIRTASRRVSAANGWVGNAFKSWMPTGLYARSLLIMIVPMVILQAVVAFVIFAHRSNIQRILNGTESRFGSGNKADEETVGAAAVTADAEEPR